MSKRKTIADKILEEKIITNLALKEMGIDIMDLLATKAFIRHQRRKRGF